VVLLSAAESGLYELILDKKMVKVKDVAREFNWSERGAEILLNALCAMEYLIKKEDNYQFNPEYDQVFSEKEYPLLKEWLRHEWRLLNRWIHLNQVLESGEPYREPEKKQVHRNHKNFILSMAHRENENLESLLENISLADHQHLLDLGGGPGLFSIALAEKYPQLHVTIFDTPETEPIAEQFIEASKAARRINFVSGNFLEDALGEGYDAALLSSILHIYGPEQNRRLLKNLYDAMKPRSRVFIRDFFLNQDKSGPLIGALFAVNMLVNTENGNAYTAQEMQEWLLAAGFYKIKMKNLEGRMALLECYRK
jgi:2-polyprenyl-3-methyl-5-hydroxy-6-metoxy-1,4-benzoquinol methylase